MDLLEILLYIQIALSASCLLQDYSWSFHCRPDGGNRYFWCSCGGYLCHSLHHYRAKFYP